MNMAGLFVCILGLGLTILLTQPHFSCGATIADTTNRDVTLSGLSEDMHQDLSSSSLDMTTAGNQQGLGESLNHCRYDYKPEFTDDLYHIGDRSVRSYDMTFTIRSSQRACYLTRTDIEGKIDRSITETVIGNFWFNCQDPGTKVQFFEDTNQTEASRFDNYISYFKTKTCSVGLKGIEMVASMTDLRVVILFGDKVWDLSEIQARPEVCNAFTNVVSFGVLDDWSSPNHLHFLAQCADHLRNMVEVAFINDSLTSFPENLKAAMPNMRAIGMNLNKLTSPLVFPWLPGYVELPQNLSRTNKFNTLYTFENSFDINDNLFRRVYCFDDNHISSLTNFQFNGQFQYISFQRNGMRNISAMVFENVTDLQFLSLAYNKLETLPEDIFAKLYDLRRLDLQGNRLKYLSLKLFYDLRNLYLLNLAGNQLVAVQNHVFGNLEKLTALSLQNNSITCLPLQAISPQSAGLKTLTLQNNPLSQFPVEILLLSGLREVNLDNTNITILDFVQIDNLTTPIELGRSLVNPSVTTIKVEDDPVVEKTISLRNSRLHSMVMYNHTRETLETFIYLIKFYSIYIEGSPLACDANILNVTHAMKSLEASGVLKGNEVSLTQWACAWPEDLKGRLVVELRDEETYSLLGEKGVPDPSCPDLCACYVRTSLNTAIVDCQHSGLTSLPPYVPANTRELWLQNNTITTVGKLPYLQDLYDLKLTSNHIQALPGDLLAFMKDLRLLFVDDNYLTGLEPRLEHVRHLRISGNPFRCDCNTLWMKSWLLVHQSVVLDWFDIKCSTEEKEGQVFTAVTDDQFVCKTSPSLGQLAVPIAIPLSFFVVILTLCVVGFLQRRRLKVLLYIHTGLHPFDRDQSDHKALYDVTVCCEMSARAWVLEHVIRPLEEEKYTTFFYYRDARLGLTTLENIRDCVQHSRRLVIVLTRPDWHTDHVMATASREALTKCRKEMVHFLTVVVHDFAAKEMNNKDLEQFIKKKRYIHAGNKHFFKRLLYEMPTTSAANTLEGERGGNHVSTTTERPVCLNDVFIVAEDGQMPQGQVATKINHTSAADYYNVETGSEASQTDSGVVVTHSTACMETDSHLNHNTQSIFLWYAQADLPFTRTNILEPLENLGHRCVLQDRDFIVGAAIQENIVDAAETCTRSVFVLSNQTTENEWFTFAFQVTFDRHLQSQGQSMVLLMRQGTDVSRLPDEVKQVVGASTVLTEDDPWFQERLVNFVEN